MSKDIYWYQRFVKSRDTRFAILKALSFVPDSIMLPLQYRIKMGRWPNLKHPTRWTEKLQLYKMYYRNPILPTCVDKYRVRSFIEGKGLSETLNKLYGLYDNANDINFEKLPSSFVIKTTDGGGGNNVKLINNKNDIDLESLKEEVNSWLNIKDINAGREWAYTEMKKSQIIIEELLVNEENPAAGIEDFKILCFYGEPKYIIVDKDRYIDHKRNFYTPEWERIDVTTDHKQFEDEYPRLKNFDRMMEVASKLSSDFPFVRVDLYNLDGKIYFGELTFYPWTGYIKFTPDSFDEHLGSLMDTSSFTAKH